MNTNSLDQIVRRCECPTKGFVYPSDESMYSEEERSGMNHKPNECQGTNEVKLYKRGDRKLWLCSCCYLGGDEEVNED